jgi:prepilin-type N-terminal cleavage/methylation domain-containing protein
MNTGKTYAVTRHRGFTLVELLVVLLILGLLAGLVGPRVLKYLGGAKSDTAQLQIGEFGAGLDLFHLEVGRYPTPLIRGVTSTTTGLPARTATTISTRSVVTTPTAARAKTRML